jgi:hypothetical protein
MNLEIVVEMEIVIVVEMNLEIAVEMEIGHHFIVFYDQFFSNI